MCEIPSCNSYAFVNAKGVIIEVSFDMIYILSLS